MALDDEIMATPSPATWRKQGVKSSSILAMNNDFGRGAATAYDAAFKKAGIKLVSTEFFDPGQPDYRPVLTRLKRAGAETILGVILASDGAPFMRQYRELGLTQKSVLARQPRLRRVPPPGEGQPQGRRRRRRGQLLDHRPRSRVGQEVAASATRSRRASTAPGRHHAQVGGGAGAGDRAQEARQGRPRDDPRRRSTEVDVKDSPLGPIKFDANHQAWINMILLEMQDGKLHILEKLPTSPALLN